MRIDIDTIKYETLGRLREVDKRILIVLGVGVPLIVILGTVSAVRLLTPQSRSIAQTVDEPAGAGVAQKLHAVVAAKETWSGVRVVASSSEGRDRILVMGFVPTQTDLSALRQEVESQAGDLKVQWQVSVAPAD